MALVAYWTRRKENDADPLQSINLTKYSRESEEVRHPSLLHVMIIIDIILRRDGQDITSGELTFEDERCGSVLVPRDGDLRHSVEVQKQSILHNAWTPVAPQWMSLQKQLVDPRGKEASLKLLNAECIPGTEQFNSGSVREARIYEIDWNKPISLIQMLVELGDVLEEDGIVVFRSTAKPEPKWSSHSGHHFSHLWANNPRQFEKYNMDSYRSPINMAEYQWLRDLSYGEYGEEPEGTLDRNKCHGIYRFEAGAFKDICEAYLSSNQKKKATMQLSFGSVWNRFDPWLLLLHKDQPPIEENNPFSCHKLLSPATIMALQAIPQTFASRVHPGSQVPVFPLCIPEYGPDRDRKSAMDRVDHPLRKWYKRLPPYLLASTISSLKLEEPKRSWDSVLEKLESEVLYQKIVYPSERVGTRNTVRPLEKRYGPLLHASLHVCGSSRLWFVLNDGQISKVQSELLEGSCPPEELKSGAFFIHPTRLLTAGFICHRQVVGDLVIVHPSITFETIDRDGNLSSEIDFLTLESLRWFDLHGVDYQGSFEPMAQIRERIETAGQRAVNPILDAGIKKAAGMLGLPVLGKR